MVRTWIILGILTGACRDGSAPTPPAPPAPAVSPKRAGSATSTPRPSLPELVTPADGGIALPLNAETAFDAEPVDRFWKTNTEAEIRRRVPGANAIECHQTTCKITLVEREADLSAAIDAMETEQSLRGIAESILLTAPYKQPDGKVGLRAFAQFVH